MFSAEPQGLSIQISEASDWRTRTFSRGKKTMTARRQSRYILDISVCGCMWVYPTDPNPGRHLWGGSGRGQVVGGMWHVAGGTPELNSWANIWSGCGSVALKLWQVQIVEPLAVFRVLEHLYWVTHTHTNTRRSFSPDFPAAICFPVVSRSLFFFCFSCPSFIGLRLS